MKRILSAVLAMLLCGCFLCPAFAEEALTSVHCDEQDFSIRIPLDKTAYWEENVGLRVSVGEPGYVPYVAVFRRPTKLSNPVNYLNNVYREYMENRYDNNVGTNPCRSYEIGGKTLYAATYHYEVSGNKLCLTLMIEVRDDGDVEYYAKYLEGKPDETMAVLDPVVRYYQPDVQAQGRALLPLEQAGRAVNTGDGVYWARISDMDRIMDGGFFTVSLYLADQYPADEIEKLQAGDSVQVSGQRYTVAELKKLDESKIELSTQESFEGYIVFQKEEGVYTALVNDWTPVSFLADYRVMLPLPYDFSFGWLSGGEEATVYDADAFVKLITGSGTGPVPAFSQYNTMIAFRDGLLMTVLHADYPVGPIE